VKSSTQKKKQGKERSSSLGPHPDRGKGLPYRHFEEGKGKKEKALSSITLRREGGEENYPPDSKRVEDGLRGEA